MSTLLGSLRRRVLAPSFKAVSFAGRGFAVEPTEATARLEAIPQSVVAGFEWGIDSPGQWDLERRLDLVEAEYRGFAYEGATMASAVLDAMSFRPSSRTRDLLLGPGQPHIFLTYIGIGFAMARLPRPLWKKIVPDISGTPYHPTMSWLAVDGYGFDRAYFDTGKIVDRQHVLQPYPWDGHPRYFSRAVDQGIGRALWFINGGHPGNVAAAVARFVPGRQADLWSGVGLAATFAGGADAEGLASLKAPAGPHAPELALGAVFATKARTYSGFVPPHTETGIRALGGVSISDAVRIADETEVAHDAGDEHTPAYEIWRDRIRREFSTSKLRSVA
ncbi:DUF1702 family protein [Amycolatopsis magusensis]|uniref:DUF1702 family protein n=1 Tax=Amycolatopsis magusensis TaxID=882444 RepID=UPI0024A99A7D|nr:DUF1702 family protein [Amycolatopsis magusensis]MDI5980862.1 DUF1702 family protein [Amycolatopsis magusensis]